MHSRRERNGVHSQSKGRRGKSGTKLTAHFAALGPIIMRVNLLSGADQGETQQMVLFFILMPVQNNDSPGRAALNLEAPAASLTPSDSFSLQPPSKVGDAFSNCDDS